MRPVTESEARTQQNTLHALCLLLLGLSSGCATTYRPAHTAPGAFTFTLTPEQCERLSNERRDYSAAREVATYAVGAGLVCTGVALGFTDSKTATAICTGVGGVAEGVSIFTGSQVGSLEEELRAGGCGR